MAENNQRKTVRSGARDAVMKVDTLPLRRYLTTLCVKSDKDHDLIYDSIIHIASFDDKIPPTTLQMPLKLDRRLAIWLGPIRFVSLQTLRIEAAGKSKSAEVNKLMALDILSDYDAERSGRGKKRIVKCSSPGSGFVLETTEGGHVVCAIHKTKCCFHLAAVQ
jgi:hypothetical protein